MRRDLTRRSATLLAAGALLFACTKKPYDLDASLVRLERIDPRAANERTLAELDVSGNGALDASDWLVLERVSGAARAELAKRHKSLDAANGLYHGLGPTADNPFDSLKRRGDGLDLSGLDEDALRVVAIEARWLALQARMAALADGRADERHFGGLLVDMVPRYDAESMQPKDLCAAIGELDLTPLERAGVQATAVMDLDSTVWAGNVMDAFLAVLVADRIPKDDSKVRGFLKSLRGADAKKIDAASAVENAKTLQDRWSNHELPTEMRISAKDTFYGIVGLMRGLTPEEATRAAVKAYETGAAGCPAWKGNVFADGDGCSMRQVVARLQERGVKVYLLSATLDVLAREGGRMLGVPRERALGSLLEVKDGKFTGEVRDSTYYTKGAIARQWLEAPPLLAFGDSPTSDFSMLLEAAGAGFMINPRDSLVKRDREEAGARLVAVVFDGTEGALASTP